MKTKGTKPYSYVEIPDLVSLPAIPLGKERRERLEREVSALRNEKTTHLGYLRYTPEEEGGETDEIKIVCKKETLLSALEGFLKEGKEPNGLFVSSMERMGLFDVFENGNAARCGYDGFRVPASDMDAIVMETEAAMTVSKAAEAFNREYGKFEMVKFRNKDKGLTGPAGATHTWIKSLDIREFLGIGDDGGSAYSIGGHDRFMPVWGDNSRYDMKVNVVCCAHSDGKPYPDDRPVVLNEFRYPLYENEYSGKVVAEYSVWAMFRRDADAEISYVLARAAGMKMGRDGEVKHLNDWSGKEIQSLLPMGYPTGRMVKLKAGAIPEAMAKAYNCIEHRIETTVQGEDGKPEKKILKGYSTSIPETDSRRGVPEMDIAIRKEYFSILSDPSFPDNADILRPKPVCGNESIDFSFLSSVSGKYVMAERAYPATEIVPKGKEGMAEEALRKVSAEKDFRDVKMGFVKHYYDDGVSPEERAERSEKSLRHLREDLRNVGAYYRGEKKIILYPSIGDVGKKIRKSYLGRADRRLFKHEMKRIRIGLSPEEYEKRFLKKGRGV